MKRTLSRRELPARPRLYSVKLHWRTAYRIVEGELRALHPDEPRYVASFFLRTSSDRAKSDEDGEPESAVEPANEESAPEERPASGPAPSGTPSANGTQVAGGTGVLTDPR